MSKILLLSATNLEHGQDNICGIPIHIVGIGKTNSAINSTRLIIKHDPDVVINFGSCGSIKNYDIGSCLKVGTAVNDFDGAGTADSDPIQFNIRENITCFTTDSFYNQGTNKYTDEYLKLIKTCDVVDMELYSIAASCLAFKKPLYCYKWVSDNGDSSNWLQNASLGLENFKKLFESEFL